MRWYLSIVCAFLMTVAANAQTVLTVTNAAYTPAPDPANPDHYLYSSVGPLRLNVNVTDGGGGPPLDISDIQTSGTFRLEVFDVIDDYRLQNIANTTTPEIDVSQGQLRWTVSSLSPRTYELKATAVPVDTNDSFVIHWSYLTVTSAPSASSASFSFIDISANTITANFMSASDGVFGNVSFTNSISTIDSLARTSSVLKVGDTMTGPVTNEAGFYGNAVGLTNFSVTASDVSVAYTPTNYTDADDVEAHLVQIDSALASVSAGGVSIDWFTNQYAMIGYTNGSGQVVYPFDNVPEDVVNSNSWFYSYNAADPGLNNSNFGAWVSTVTNGMRRLEFPFENVNQPRMADWVVIPSGSVVRAAVYFPESLKYAIFDSYRYMQGLGFWCSGTGDFHIPFDYDSGTTGGQIRWLQYSSAFSLTVPTGAAGGFWGDHDYGSSKSLYQFGMAYPFWCAVDHDGVLTCRTYIGKSLDSLTLVGVRTNVPPITGMFVGFARFQSYGSTNGYVRYDNYNGEIGGRLWSDAGTY